jgi:hypothetical protein
MPFARVYDANIGGSGGIEEPPHIGDRGAQDANIDATLANVAPRVEEIALHVDHNERS